MAATIIDGREVAAQVRADVAREVQAIADRGGRLPGLATILVGDDPASVIYVANKRKASAELGIADFHRQLPADSSQADVAGLIEALNADTGVSGILLQLPVPDGLDLSALQEVRARFLASRHRQRCDFSASHAGLGRSLLGAGMALGR